MSKTEGCGIRVPWQAMTSKLLTSAQRNHLSHSKCCVFLEGSCMDNRYPHCSSPSAVRKRLEFSRFVQTAHPKLQDKPLANCQQNPNFLYNPWGHAEATENSGTMTAVLSDLKAHQHRRVYLRGASRAVAPPRKCLQTIGLYFNNRP